jgi:polyhydroxyalkanoate synthesis regulator phasin
MGPWVIAALLAVGATTTETGRRVLRKTARGAVKAGYTVVDKGACVLAEAKEHMNDMVEEVRSEQADGDAEHDHEEGAHKSVKGRKATRKSTKTEEA